MTATPAPPVTTCYFIVNASGRFYVVTIEVGGDYCLDRSGIKKARKALYTCDRAIVRDIKNVQTEECPAKDIGYRVDQLINSTVQFYLDEYVAKCNEASAVIYNGLIKKYYPDGQLHKRFARVDARDGPYASYYPTGLRRTSCMYKGGALVDIKKKWYPSGNLMSVHDYSAGKRTSYVDRAGSPEHRETYYHLDDGKLAREVTYSNGKPEKEEVHATDRDEVYTFHANGEKASQQVRNDAGKMHGVWKTWDDTGQLLEEIAYANGKRYGSYYKHELDNGTYLVGQHEEGRRVGLWRRRLLGSDCVVWCANYRLEGYIEKNFCQTDGGRWYKHTVINYDNKGKLHGTCTMYDDAQHMMDKTTYCHGVLDGPCTQWVGLAETHGQYKDGRKTGEWITLFAGERVIRRVQYDMDKDTCVKIWYRRNNGEPKCLESYRYNATVKHGAWKKWDKGGSLVKNEFYLEDKLQPLPPPTPGDAPGDVPGIKTAYDTNGTLTHYEQRLGGLLHGPFYHDDGEWVIRGKYFFGEPAGTWTKQRKGVTDTDCQRRDIGFLRHRCFVDGRVCLPLSLCMHCE